VSHRYRFAELLIVRDASLRLNVALHAQVKVSSIPPDSAAPHVDDLKDLAWMCAALDEYAKIADR
jgi:hypothetical protein